MYVFTLGKEDVSVQQEATQSQRERHVGYAGRLDDVFTPLCFRLVDVSLALDGDRVVLASR